MSSSPSPTKGFPSPAAASIVLVISLLFSFGLLASPSSDELRDDQTVVSTGLSLPVWAEGETGESFDVRIWPESVMLWLEQENLRDMIADPNTTESEKQELKRILAMQRAWRVPGSGER